MTICEWDGCHRKADFTIILKGSNSSSNLFFACWQHKKKYNDQKFVEDTFGKGATVEISRHGRARH